MTRETFERELQKLQDDVLLLGKMVEQAVMDSVTALRQRDKKSARRVRAGDQQINEKRYQIEQDCLTLIATQQPMARDLRTIASVFAITIDLERMADHAEGISRAVKRLGQEPPVKPLVDIPKMDEILQQMIRETLDAFRDQDVERARAVARKDDEVDALRNRVLHDLLDLMIRNPGIVPRALELLIVARHLERAADHLTNVCERIVYMVTGELRELNV